MRNHQQCDPEDATIAKLGDATLECESDGGCDWYDATAGAFIATGTLIRYGATFWKPIVPEPGYRLVEDHERVGEKPKGCRMFVGIAWYQAPCAAVWEDDRTYAVPIEQVVAVKHSHDEGFTYEAYFATEELRDRAVERANRGEL